MRSASFAIVLCFLTASSLHARDLYVLAAGDLDNPEIGPGVEKSLQWVVAYFERQAPSELLKARVLAGKRLTAAALLRSVETCPASEGDAFVLWWIGRTECEGQEHLLVMADGDRLPRSRLSTAITEKVNASLNVLITDGVTAALPSDPLADLSDAPEAVRIRLFDELFLNCKGVIDIAAAAPGGRSIMLGGCGGLLTAALVLPPQVMRNDPPSIQIEVESDQGRRQVLLAPGAMWRSVHETRDWSQVLTEAQNAAADYSRQAAGSENPQAAAILHCSIVTTQSLLIYESQAGRFRSYPREKPARPGDGSHENPVAIDSKAPGEAIPPGDTSDSPPGDAAVKEMLGGRLAADADQGCQLSSGDLIVAVNGRAIRTQQDFVAAVGRSPETMQFTIRSSQTGRRLNFQTRLRSGPGSRFGVVATEAPLGGVTVVEVREDYPGANAQLTGAEENDLPKAVPFGARGRFAPLRSEYLDNVARALVVDEVKPDSPAAWAGVKAGDKIIAIGDLHFESDEGYRYAVAYAPFRATVLILDGQTNLPANRTTYIPRSLPDRIQPVPPGVRQMILSIDFAPASAGIHQRPRRRLTGDLAGIDAQRDRP